MPGMIYSTLCLWEWLAVNIHGNIAYPSDQEVVSSNEIVFFFFICFQLVVA